jgi:hypothetical protein
MAMSFATVEVTIDAAKFTRAMAHATAHITRDLRAQTPHARAAIIAAVSQAIVDIPGILPMTIGGKAI